MILLSISAGIFFTLLQYFNNEYLAFSHNFSEAAWGKLNKDVNSLYISNTELGMIIPSLNGKITRSKQWFYITSSKKGLNR